MDKVADHAHSFVVDACILSSQHVDQGGQGIAFHNQVLVFLVLEGQRSQRSSSGPLDLQPRTLDLIVPRT